jgi:hypothetical protein
MARRQLQSRLFPVPKANPRRHNDDVQWRRLVRVLQIKTCSLDLSNRGQLSQNGLRANRNTVLVITMRVTDWAASGRSVHQLPLGRRKALADGEGCCG